VKEASQFAKSLAGSAIDLEALMTRLRQQAALKRAAVAATWNVQPVDARAFNWPQVQAGLNHAARLASTPATVPALGRFRGLTRRLARLVLRGFLSVARVITVRQSDWNGCVLEALRETAEGLRNLEREVARQNERIRQLEAVLWRDEARKSAS
jgi:hypothetical protein